jgi:hypothetical protein
LAAATPVGPRAAAAAAAGVVTAGVRRRLLGSRRRLPRLGLPAQLFAGTISPVLFALLGPLPPFAQSPVPPLLSNGALGSALAVTSHSLPVVGPGVSAAAAGTW